MSCTAITKSGRKCHKGPLCHIHRIQTCTVCLEPIQYKDTRRLPACRHVFHAPCIASWFVTSNVCPVCRADQSADPLIEFKNQVEESVRTVYQDAIHSLEDDVRRLQTPSRRPRSIFPRSLSYAGTMRRNNTPGNTV